MIRLIEDSFPNLRALEETGGLDEERRIFYVGITRAKNELILTYPHRLARGGRGPMMMARASRFLTEIDPKLYEIATLETDWE